MRAGLLIKLLHPSAYIALTQLLIFGLQSCLRRSMLKFPLITNSRLQQFNLFKVWVN